jgi:hypothetical protein
MFVVKIQFTTVVVYWSLSCLMIGGVSVLSCSKSFEGTLII